MVKNKDRMKYEGGKQRTVRIDKNALDYAMLKMEVERICSWLKGHAYEVHHHISGTSPKQYKLIDGDSDVVAMSQLPFGKDCVEVVISTKDGSDFGLGISKDKPLPVKDYNLKRGDDVLHDEAVINRGLFIGATYESGANFKHALRCIAISENFGVKITYSDRTRVIATCAYLGCPWRVRASLYADGQTFQVRTVEDNHLCPGVNRAGNKLVTTNWVASEIEEVVKRHPDIPPRELNENLEIKYGLNLPYMKLWRSRELAKANLFGPIEDSYMYVPMLTAELLNRNPGSHILYECDAADHSFRRMFISFKVCVDGFIAGCRPLIGLDACHLKSKFLGMLLAANALDGNNGLFTIAFAVVESESKSAWRWFLEHLADSFECDLTPLAFISDMEKGLAEAIKIVFPFAEHRVCMRHMWKNIKKQHHFQESHAVRATVWNAANAYIKCDYEVHMEKLFHLSPQVHEYLISLPYKWSRSQFDEAIKSHTNTNNLAESFNAWVTEARDKPIVELVDTIRGKLMEQRAERKILSASWRGVVVPAAEEYIREVTTRKEVFIVRQSTSEMAEVEGKNARHEVDLTLQTCTCMYWQMTGLPCIHAIAFITRKEHPIWHIYVNHFHHVFRYCMCYEGAIATLLDKKQWIARHDDSQIGPPMVVRPRGRPRKRRLKSFLEIATKKDKRIHACSRCHQWGHHKNTCKEALDANIDHMPPVEMTHSMGAVTFSYNCMPGQKLPIRRTQL